MRSDRPTSAWASASPLLPLIHQQRGRNASSSAFDACSTGLRRRSGGRRPKALELLAPDD